MKFDLKKHNEYLDEKIVMLEEDYCGPLSETEKERIRSEFFQKYEDFAAKCNIHVDVIYGNFDLFVELDELIDYDFEIARLRVFRD